MRPRSTNWPGSMTPTRRALAKADMASSPARSGPSSTRTRFRTYTASTPDTSWSDPTPRRCSPVGPRLRAEGAHRGRAPVAALGLWQGRPHPARRPEKTWGAENQIRTPVTKGFPFPGEHSELNGRLKNRRMTPDEPMSLEQAIRKAGRGHEDEGVQQWIDAHPGIVDEVAPVKWPHVVRGRAPADSSGVPRGLRRAEPPRTGESGHVLAYEKDPDNHGAARAARRGTPPAGGTGRARISNSAPRPTTSRHGGRAR